MTAPTVRGRLIIRGRGVDSEWIGGADAYLDERALAGDTFGLTGLDGLDVVIDIGDLRPGLSSGIAPGMTTGYIAQIRDALSGARSVTVDGTNAAAVRQLTAGLEGRLE